jgi:predicted protein tyrosine phosphatase
VEIIIADRNQIERGIVVRMAYVVISIRDPGTRRPRIPKTAGLRGTLYLRFHDAEPVRGEILPSDIVPMTERDARRIWAFLHAHIAQIGAIVIHCEQGASRSAGVATAVADVLGIDLADELIWTQPNRFVYELVREAAIKTHWCSTRGAQ